MSNLRLIFPEWQGGGKEACDLYMKDIPQNFRYLAYYYGALISKIIAPKHEGPEETVPVPTGTTDDDMKIEDGFYSASQIREVVKNAIQIIEKHDPARITTFGGECTTSVPPFSYLAKKYEGNIALIWIDKHPDINIPYETNGYNAMALAHILGLGDEQILKSLPGKIPTNRAIYFGLMSFNAVQKKRIDELHLPSVSPDDYRSNPNAILDWLKSTGCQKVVIHIDLDALDPQDLFIAAGPQPGGLKMKEIIETVNQINQCYDIVGFTVAEHVPRTELMLAQFLSELSIFKSK